MIDTTVKVADKLVGEYDIIPNPWVEEVYDDDWNLIAVELHGHKNIRDGMCKYCSSLTSIIIPDSVTKIGSYAFSKCTSLMSITIPNGVTEIRNWAFSWCSGLTSITIPDGVTTLENYVFAGCSGLTSITIPNGVTSIGNTAFAKCTGLTSVIFKGTPTTISSTAFNGCTNLTDIKVPWAEGVVANAPWGATNATITYNYTADTNAEEE